MDSRTLISKVKQNPEIWDKSLKDYSNRVVVDECWQDIAKQMGFTDTALRRKWKYLRDQFCVEFGKMKTSRPGKKSYEPKWPHYKSLLFLKDVVKPRICSKPQNVISIKTTPICETKTEIVDDFEDVDDTNDQSENEEGNVQYEKHDQIQDCEGDGKRKNIGKEKRRRTQGNYNNYNGTTTEMGNKTVQCFEDLFKNCQTENDDLLFFRSLLPHVSKIPENMKLSFRSQIQEVVDEFAYHRKLPTS